MDAPSISLDGAIFALFLLAIAGLGAMVMVFGTNIRKDIAKLFELMENHQKDDAENFKFHGRRTDLIAQRVTKLDGRTEEV